MDFLNVEANSLTVNLVIFAICAAAIWLAGTRLAYYGDAIAAAGVGASFVGATLLPGSTSLPEISTTLRSVRLGNFSMAVSNIFGSNAILVFFVMVADVVYRGGSVLAAVDRPAMLAALLGIVVTGVYVAGMLERDDRSILRLGYDSWIVLGLYAAMLVLLYTMR